MYTPKPLFGVFLHGYENLNCLLCSSWTNSRCKGWAGPKTQASGERESEVRDYHWGRSLLYQLGRQLPQSETDAKEEQVGAPSDLGSLGA